MKQLVTDRSYSINTPPPTFFNLLITDEEFNLFRKLIYDKSGINLSPEKKSLIQTRLIKRLHLRNCETFYQYYRYINMDRTGEEMIAMLNAISTNLTKFFREEEHFNFLNNKVLPDLISNKRKNVERKLRVWSAGCSSGEEAYTLGITVLRHIDTPLVWNIKILATDISTDILQMAAEGVYEVDKISNLPKELLNEYFVKDNAGYNNCYKVTPLLRDIITFRRLNLIDETYPFKGKFDFIFCRNVMIYFDKKTQEGIVNRFYNHLEDGGYLFIGHSESLNGVKSPFKYELPAVYRKGAVLK
ncbi:MAG: protein-glutamate O-methyltransferase CheR [Nitrospirota bacterium]